jgi:signal transduction histidine kinase
MERWLERFARTNFLRSSDTAHDLKTPLNVAVLNLELLRMRIRKLTGVADDAKVQEYTAAIETELRRMARIFDTFFLLSTPPKGDEAPIPVDVATIFVETAAESGLTVPGDVPSMVIAHEARIRQAFRLLFDAAAKLFPTGTLQAAIDRDRRHVTVTITGNRPEDDFEPTKLFKFYYTDALGNPDLALATARLIFETYGGELNAAEESDKVAIRLSLPLGES